MTSAVVKSGIEKLIIGPDAQFDDSPAAVSFADGSYAIIWFRGDGGALNELQFQRYDTAGAPIGSLLSLAHGVSGFSFMQAELLPNGNVGIVYQENYGGLADVKLTVVSQTGALVVAPQTLATTVAGEQSDVSLAIVKINGVDQLLATWEDWNGSESGVGADSTIRARYLNLDGTASAININDFVVNTSDGGMQVNAAVAASAVGGGVIVWNDYSNATGYTAVKAKVIAADGTFGAEFTVAAEDYHQEHPTVAYLPNGKFVVALAHNTVEGSHAVEIQTRVFNADGTPAGAVQGVTQSLGDKFNPNIEVLSDGGFLITWTETGDPDNGAGDVIKARAFGADGAPIGAELTVSTTLANNQTESETIALADGRVLVLYTAADSVDIAAQIVDARDPVVNPDTIETALNSYDLNANATSHNLTFIGSGNFSGIGNNLANTIVGGAGNDHLDGGAGADTLIGGAGDDTYVVDNISDIVTEGASGGNDTIQTALSSFYLASTPNVENLVYLGASNFIGVGTSSADRMTGGAHNDYFYTYDGNDVANGGGGIDVFVMGAGADTAYGGADQDYLFGGEGDDFLYGDGGVDVLNGEASNDTMYGGDGGDYFYGGSGDDLGYGEAGNDIFVMEVGNDVAYGGDGQDYFYMGAGDDTMHGGAGVDVMLGEAGNDTFDGGLGVDYLFLGAGGAGDNDTVIVSATQTGVEVVNGFEAGGANDSIQLAGTGWTSFAQVQAAITDYSNEGGFCVLTIDADTSIWFIGVQPGQFTAADFTFI